MKPSVKKKLEPFQFTFREGTEGAWGYVATHDSIGRWLAYHWARAITYVLSLSRARAPKITLRVIYRAFLLVTEGSASIHRSEIFVAVSLISTYWHRGDEFRGVFPLLFEKWREEDEEKRRVEEEEREQRRRERKQQDLLRARQQIEIYAGIVAELEAENAALALSSGNASEE